jgi:hypothetical protein
MKPPDEPRPMRDFVVFTIICGVSLFVLMLIAIFVGTWIDSLKAPKWIGDYIFVPVVVGLFLGVISLWMGALRNLFFPPQ